MISFLKSLYAAKNPNSKKLHDWSCSQGRFMKRAIGDDTCRGYFNEYCKYAGVARADDEPLLPKVKKLRSDYYKLCSFYSFQTVGSVWILSFFSPKNLF